MDERRDLQARREQLSAAKRALLRAPFALESDGLLRVHLLQLGARDHLLCTITHHIVFDGWSEALFVAELCTLYAALSAGSQADLPDLPIQYVDYARWQRAKLTSDRLQAQLAYWKARLSGDLPPDVLLTDRPRPALPSARGATESLVLPSELLEQATDLGRREGATLFMVLLAALQALLQRYSGQVDLVVGTMVVGRDHPATEHLLGAFANTVVLRTDLSGDPTFRDVLSRVRRTSLEAYAHQELPHDLVVRELSPTRDLSRNPFFQVAFGLEDFGGQSRSAGGLIISPHRVEPDVALYDLSVEFTRSGDALQCAFTYSVDLFDGGTIRQLAAHYLALLKGALADPGRRLSELPLLTDAERQRILVDWNATPALACKARCIHQHFEEQVDRAPDAVAVRWRDQSLTYGDLDQQANRLARYLRALRVGADQPVFGLQAKGMGGSEAPLRSIEAMAAHYVALMRDAWPQGPYLVAGQCNGGLVAFEMARQLREMGQAPRLVALLDSQAHNVPRNIRGLPPTQILRRVWRRGRRRVRRRIARWIGSLWGRPQRDGSGRGREMAGVGLEDTAGRPASDVLKAFWYAFSHYRPRPYEGSVTLFRAQTHARPRFDEETGGWRALAQGGVEIHDVPGEHGAILREPNVRVLAEALSACIVRVLAEPGASAER